MKDRAKASHRYQRACLKDVNGMFVEKEINEYVSKMSMACSLKKKSTSMSQRRQWHVR